MPAFGELAVRGELHREGAVRVEGRLAQAL